MSDAPSDRRTRRKHETRARILDAAIACFAADGFDATTMDEIAERADVARATVFNHYADKAELLDAYLARRREQVSALLRRERRADVDAIRQLHDAFDLVARINEDDPAEARALVHAWWRSGAITSEPQSAAIFAEVIADGQRRGELRAAVDPALAGRLLFDAYSGILSRWSVAAQPRPSLRAALREACDAVVDGLRA